MANETVELGFRVALREFRQTLDPGSSETSEYTSVVDFLDPGKDGAKLREKVRITLNEPVDFTDPQDGRCYRLFQTSLDGPWRPGSAEFEQFAGPDSQRDQLYLSVLSVNYDPGRGLKYAGSLLIVVGIGIVYYMKAYFFGK
jgi:hypothetical protein